MFKINVFVPKNHVEQVKTAMFAAGGGRIGKYDCCSFESEGIGQFRALDGADPYLGSVGKVEKVMEVKVEMVCEDRSIREVIAAMKEAHPYEEPAYDVFKMEEI